MRMAFPTCVGMNRESSQMIRGLKRVPYMCGDEPDVVAARIAAEQRSLHVWG